jgi:predicted dithiol-disulfide oxidoreductase (DUF899 family)
MEIPKVVSPQEWEAARQELLVKEEELTRGRAALAAERRRMPWLAVQRGPTVLVHAKREHLGLLKQTTKIWNA